MCKAGEADKAYETACLDLNNEPDNVWVQREVGWALYYLIKNDIEEKKKDLINEHFAKLAELDQLNMTSDNLIYENILWKLAEYVKSIASDDLVSISELFSAIQAYRFLPSRPYSFLLQNCLKFDGWSQMASFIDWWDLVNLQKEDFEQYKLENGKKIMSLAERVYIAYSKALIKTRDKDQIGAFVPKLEALMETHPDMLYPGYFCGKLLIVQGVNRDEALEKVVPFVRKKVNEFWAWQLMSDIFKDDYKLQLACLLRAVHCKTQESFLGKIRIRLAELYLQNKDQARAKYHIDKVSTCYLKQGWRLPGLVQQWSWQSWLQTTVPDSSDPFDYTPITNELLYKELPKSLAVVTYVDAQAKRASLVYGVKKRMMVRYANWKLFPKEGMIIEMKYTLEGDKLNVVDVEQTSIYDGLDYVKIVSGRIEKREGSPFAFLKSGSEKLFISPNVVAKYHLTGNDTISALAVLDFNKKKNEWNWSCISINK